MRRRQCLQAAFGSALGAGWLEALAADPPPETTRLRMARTAAICFAPTYVAGDGLLQAEGFDEVSYPASRANSVTEVAEGRADMGATDVATLLTAIDKGQPVTVLGGLHPGCYELFATAGLASLRDLKGRSMAVTALQGSRHLTLAAILTYVGLDPARDVQWVVSPAAQAMQQLAEGRIDAFLAFPPEPQELRARKIGRLLLSMTTNRPWSDHYCCMVFAHREFVRANPSATKRALRAIYKAAAICGNEPERAARVLLDMQVGSHNDYTLQMLRELPYASWRDYDPTTTMRFYAVRLHEAGLLHGAPDRLIEQGSDWRFVEQVKRELKS